MDNAKYALCGCCLNLNGDELHIQDTGNCRTRRGQIHHPDSTALESFQTSCVLVSVPPVIPSLRKWHRPSISGAVVGSLHKAAMPDFVAPDHELQTI